MKTVKLTQLCAIKGGIPAPKKTTLMGNVPFVRMRELGDTHLSSTFSPGQEFLTDADEKIFTDKFIDPGAVLFPRSGSVHLNHRAHLETKAAIVSHIGALIPKQGTDSLFLYHPLTDYDMTEIMTQTTGLNMIRFSQLADVEFQIPDTLPEQTKIAEVLSTVDQAIEQTEALIAKQQRIKTGLMQDLLTRGIDEYGNLRSEQTHEFKDSPLGRIPVEWEVQPCISLCREIVVGIVIRPVQYYRPDGVPVLRSANVKENKITNEALVFMSDKDNEKLSKSRLHKGDLVTVRTGYPGTTGVIPPELDGSNCVDIVISRPNHEKVRSEFLSIWINSDHGKKQVIEGQGGLAQQHFNVGEMRTLLVKVPDINEQEIIENLLILQSSAIDELAENQQKLRSLKTALMQDLLTGKKRVTMLLNKEVIG